MGLLEILVAVLIVVLLFLVFRWLFGMLKVNVPQEILAIIALLLLILILLGRVNISL